MTAATIQVDNLGKCYTLGQHRPMGVVRQALRRWLGRSQAAADAFWAIRQINLTIKPGEAVGIIGGNGAGKSTFLKILSRITEPTEGRATIRGRVGSLLEVGTGFHPELTGRENVYLNGAILGMARSEITGKFDQIVEFSGVGAFLDTPVKRYSSGMRVRLGFAVAAHLDPEILIVDEVLAVGDAAFQARCMGKMNDLSRGGRTVLFVSHNMGAIADLCTRCVVFRQGRLLYDCEPRQAIKQYLAVGAATGSRIDLTSPDMHKQGDGPMRLLGVEFFGGDGVSKSTFQINEPITVRTHLKTRPGRSAILGVTLRDEAGHPVIHLNNTDDRQVLTFKGEESCIVTHIKQNLLNAGTYYLSLWVGDETGQFNEKALNCATLTVDASSHGFIRCGANIRLPAEWAVG